MKIRRFNLSKPTKLLFICMIVLPILFIGTKSIADIRLPEKDEIKKDCGNDNGTYILIAYDTIHGSTAEVAEHMGDDLCSKGFKVAVRYVAKSYGYKRIRCCNYRHPDLQVCLVGGCKKVPEPKQSSSCKDTHRIFLCWAPQCQLTFRKHRPAQKNVYGSRAFRVS